MSKINELQKFGQSIWYDNVSRSMLISGEFTRLIDLGVTGVTSNPTIFEKAMAGSDDYDETMLVLIKQGYEPYQIYESMALDDIKTAADELLCVYEQTDGKDGFVSLEVMPSLAKDTSGTILEAERLFRVLDRPNVMIKVPATPDGTAAIEVLISKGININATLIFSIDQYREVAHAYISGLKKRIYIGKDISKVVSVASFFISRIDSLADSLLENAGNSTLQGKIAIANAKLAYECFQECFQGKDWEKLVRLGAQIQRPLWASTGTKNTAYKDTLYVDSLIGMHTVNTVPPATLEAFLDHGKVDSTLTLAVDEAKNNLNSLNAAGIELDSITDKLLEDGLQSFERSFDNLIKGIADKKENLSTNHPSIRIRLGKYQDSIANSLKVVVEKQIIQRIWDHDFTVWKPEPSEIINRLGWLDIADRMREKLPELIKMAEGVRFQGFKKAILLGMGGSSLAPEVLRKTFGVREGYLDLIILDSTDPGTILSLEKEININDTLFIVSTKSGTTPETLSFFKYFYNLAVTEVGQDKAGKHFIAITDPGSKLVEIAKDLGFREIYENDPNIGGRYSALSYFGLVPASLLGIDLDKLLKSAIGASERSKSGLLNDALLLGVIFGELEKSGKDKLTFFLSHEIESFGDWVEQLIAESTGKEGSGILPVVGETIGTLDEYGNDRLFVHLHVGAYTKENDVLNALVEAGHPVITIHLNDLYDLGEQFFLWEMATAIAGYCLKINPFDQPNVESSKILTRRMLKEYQENGRLFYPEPLIVEDGMTVYGDGSGESIENILQDFFDRTKLGSYISIQAYLKSSVETYN
ncbi:MAG: bifunctional transaldolase/phosoglucose isomerase, partial [Anaerolineaceae bacterium]|nr:bifunctional transaldolase/phosoglucose isomerase [Anaerolineaceae bacterium]